MYWPSRRLLSSIAIVGVDGAPVGVELGFVAPVLPVTSSILSCSKEILVKFFGSKRPLTEISLAESALKPKVTDSPGAKFDFQKGLVTV